MQLHHLFTVLLNAVVIALSVSRGTHAVPTGSRDTALGARQPYPIVHYDILDLSNITARAPRTINVRLTEGSRQGQPLAYTMGILLGTQSQASKFVFDTASGTFWVASETCPQRGNNQGLGPSSSTTFEDLNIPWSISYGGGRSRAQGTVARDSVKVGALDTMMGFPIGIADTLTGQLANLLASGIAGFTNGKIDKPTRTGGVTLLEGLFEFGLIPKSMVGIQLGRGTNGAPGIGQVTLGGFDSSKFQTGADNLVRMANQDNSKSGIWAVHVAKVNVNGQDILSDIQAILDTGGNRILVKNGDAQLFHNYPEAVKTPNGIYGVPCDHTKIPTMSFQVGSVVFTLNPIDIVGMKIGDKGYCYSLIQDLPAGSTRRWILGTPFMKSVYQILDSDANEITLAKYA